MPPTTPPTILYPNGSVMGVQVFIDDNGDPIPWDGSISVSSTGGAILDGVDSSIKATVVDFLTGNPSGANPLGVILVDTNGDPYNAGGSGGAVTIADGADVNAGSIADAGVTGNNPGTLSAKLRGISTILADVWDSVNNRVNVFIDNATLAVTQSGSWLIGGDVASGSADSGNPVKIGARAVTALPAAEASGDRINVIADTTGRILHRTAQESLASDYWDAQHVPAVNTQATATKASAGAGKRNVCTGFTVTLASNGTAPAAVQTVVSIIDGASGGGTALWTSVIALPAVAGAMSSLVRSNIWLVGSAATAMTIEFSAGGGANTIQSVTMEGTTIEE